jgi:hypothetical protein
MILQGVFNHVHYASSVLRHIIADAYAVTGSAVFGRRFCYRFGRTPYLHNSPFYADTVSQRLCVVRRSSGTGYQDVEVSADSEIIEGFTFDATNPNNVLSGGIVADDSLVLSLYYTRNKYTITFNANGGEGGVATELYYGAVLNAPSVSQAGFAFLYWFPEVPQTVPAFSATYTAQWDPLTYTITLIPTAAPAVTQEPWSLVRSLRYRLC